MSSEKNAPASPAFDEAALLAIYAPHGDAPLDLASKLCDTHRLVLSALASIDKRYAQIEDMNSMFAGFGIDAAREFPEPRAALEAIAGQDRDAQSMGATSVARCVGALDLLLRRSGVDSDACQKATGKAFSLCLAPLPERARLGWELYFERVGLALATAKADGSLPPKSGSIRM